MRFRPGATLASALSMGIGVLVLLGLLLPGDLGAYSDLQVVSADFAAIMVQLITITIGLMVIVGLMNLFLIHLVRIIRRRGGALYSLVMLMSFGLVVGTYISDRESSLILLENVQFSLEAALAGLLLFALVFGAYRMMDRQVSWASAAFIFALLLVLLGALPLSSLEIFQDARDWLLDVPVSAGARGLLLGIALATVVTGVRVLVGIDRSYRE